MFVYKILNNSLISSLFQLIRNPLRKTSIVDFWIFLSEKFRLFVSNTKISRLIRRQEDYRELDLTDIIKSVPKSWLIALPGEI